MTAAPLTDRAIVVHPADNVAVVKYDLAAGAALQRSGASLHHNRSGRLPGQGPARRAFSIPPRTPPKRSSRRPETSFPARPVTRDGAAARSAAWAPFAC